jgi:hypothetical protein
MLFKRTEPFFSKAQLEVWEWKQTLYEETKHLNTAEALKYLVEKSQTTVASLKRQKLLQTSTK